MCNSNIRYLGCDVAKFLREFDKKYKNQITVDQYIQKMGFDKSKPITSLISREDKFLKLFNKTKIEAGFKSDLKVLSKTDKNNLAQLIGYRFIDFKNAIIEMLKSDWAKKTGNQTPSHILRVDNFNRYLSQAQQSITEQESDFERTERLLKKEKEQWA